MQVKARLEKFLFRILPSPMFNALAGLSAGFRRRRIRYADSASHWRYRIQASTKRRSIRIANFDLYDWTGVDLAGHLRKHFPDSCLIVDHPLRWSEYETGKPSLPGVTSRDYAAHTHDGMRLWQLCRVSIMKHLGRIIIPSGTPVSESDLDCINRYYAWAIQCHRLVTERLEQLKPDVVLLTQGGVYDSRIVAEAARRRGITAIALENSFSANHFYADTLSGQILNRHSLTVTGSFMNECVAMDPELARQQVMDFFRTSINCKSPDHRTSGSSDGRNVLDSLAIPPDRKILLFLGQVRTDASIVLDSVLYPDPVDLIMQLADIVNRHEDYFLIVRLHPKEDTENRVMRKGNHQELCHQATLRVLHERGLYDSENVRIVSDKSINTYALMQASDLGITINSQSGLEMALTGKQVITAGRCFYAGHGFTWDLPRPLMLEPVIAAALSHRPDDHERLKLINYCHYLFFDYLISKDLHSNTARLYHLARLGTGRPDSASCA